MRVLLVPGPVGPLPAPDAARALAQGWADAAPGDDVVVRPPADDVLADHVRTAGLVVAADTLLDAAALLGDVGRAAALAQEAGVPCLVVAVQVLAGRREAAAHGVDEAYALADEAGLAAALAEPARHLRALAARAARQWSRG